MFIKDIHYDFNKKLNKIDSQQFRNLLIPEKDWVLNEAKEIFIKNQINQNGVNNVGIGINLRNIRTLVKEGIELSVINNLCVLPVDYFYYLKAVVEVSKNSCLNKTARVLIKQHDDEFEESPFDKSDFEWREVNGLFNEGGLQLFAEDFEINLCKLSYISASKYMHNAEDFNSGAYNLPSGEILTGKQECDLPDYTHREIVDIAVLIATGELQIPDYEVKMNKIKLVN